jgi:hypothetical protein
MGLKSVTMMGALFAHYRWSPYLLCCSFSVPKQKIVANDYPLVENSSLLGMVAEIISFFMLKQYYSLFITNYSLVSAICTAKKSLPLKRFILN